MLSHIFFAVHGRSQASYDLSLASSIVGPFFGESDLAEQIITQTFRSFTLFGLHLFGPILYFVGSWLPVKQLATGSIYLVLFLDKVSLIKLVLKVDLVSQIGGSNLTLVSEIHWVGWWKNLWLMEKSMDSMGTPVDFPINHFREYLMMIGRTYAKSATVTDWFFINASTVLIRSTKYWKPAQAPYKSIDPKLNHGFYHGPILQGLTKYQSRVSISTIAYHWQRMWISHFNATSIHHH